ncbi:alpha/beta fold hydrolase [Microtetraspora sp. AC03309]|uniref:alpha/beta fold hydrolase n=1 Tax=Microtetraspora sp. AC03309 TaxID=2779376 RepID=UPI001E5AC71D|nr:alpha/beta fold hydrolase [Microtetraspora sp. AC03309]MCC5580167.1 alpha/beta fold hydrolase [Microtetraspora sp. AC03309]
MLTDAQRAALAARLRQGRRNGPATPAAGPVVDLATSGTTPAFLLHAVGGSVFEYAALVRELATAFRLYGVEAAGLRPGARPGTSLAEMAGRYADAVRAAQRAGPYRLIGWSMGGVLAFETARRLEDDGADVGLVVLIDAPYRTVPSYAEHEEGLAALFAAEVMPDGRGAAADPGEPVEVQLDRLADALTADGDDRAVVREELDRRYAVFVAHISALAGYQPAAPVGADAVLVGAADTPDSVPEWAGMFRGRVRTLYTGAGHHACLRPPAVTEIARLVRSAEAEWGRPVDVFGG